MPIDYSRYPPSWKTEIVPAILSRCSGRCEECGLENHSFVWAVKFFIKNEDRRYTERSIWFRVEADAIRESKGDDHRRKKVKVVLTVAHLDHDETNVTVQLDRLRALCQACHLRYDAIEKYRRATEKWIQDAPKLL